MGTSPDLSSPGDGADVSATDTADGAPKEESARSADREKRPLKAEAAKENTPMRRALADLRSGRYEDCLVKLNEILRSDPSNAQAHYLKAVTYVMTRHYPQAAEEYRNTLANSPDLEISKLARQGLAKLGR